MWLLHAITRFVVLLQTVQILYVKSQSVAVYDPFSIFCLSVHVLSQVQAFDLILLTDNMYQSIIINVPPFFRQLGL